METTIEQRPGVKKTNGKSSPGARLGRQAMSASLAMLGRFSSLPLVHRLGLYEPAQKLTRSAVREGFKAGQKIASSFKANGKQSHAARLDRPAPRNLFDLNPTDEQQMIRDVAQRFAREVLEPAAAKADHDLAPPEGFDSQLADLALGPMAVPEAHGGAATETSTVMGALVAEDLAHGDLGLALAALAPIGVAHALVRWGSAEQQAKYLPAFAGETPPRAAFALSEPKPLFDPHTLSTRVILRGNELRLYGEKSLVPLATNAELFLVAAELVGGGRSLVLVERSAEGVSVEADPALGARAAGLGRVRFDGVRLPASALLGESPDAVDFAELVDRSRIATAALAVGTAQAVLDYVIPYVNDRKAFGEPISHRQAVAFMVSNLAIEIESMRLVTWRAAAQAEHGLDFHREAYLARVLTQEKGMEVATNGVQLLGGHGYIKEHPVERWYRDLMTLSVLEGGVLV